MKTGHSLHCSGDLNNKKVREGITSTEFSSVFLILPVAEEVCQGKEK